MINLLRPMDSSSSATSNPSSSSSQTLATEISQVFSQILQQLGIDPGSIKLTSDSGSGQISGANTPATTPSASSQTGFNALVQASILNSAAPKIVSASSSPANASSPSQHWYADDAADDAYWNAQPAAVKQLREIDDIEQRQAMAADLASKGYQIDNCVMVWGWDPGKVTALRQSFGYTWVPSATQANVTAAPGLTAPGMTPYDPANPPAGSIAVPSATTA